MVKEMLFSQYIRAKINDYEKMAQKEKDISKLTILYDMIGVLKTVEGEISSPSLDRMRAIIDQDILRGRKILKIKAESTFEALAALDILRERVISQFYPIGQGFEDRLYMTKEGCVWSG